MNKEYDIQKYMTKGVERVVADSIKATFKNPKESAFMLGFAAFSKAASKKRADFKAAGEHVPPFLIAEDVNHLDYVAYRIKRCDGEEIRFMHYPRYLRTNAFRSVMLTGFVKKS